MVGDVSSGMMMMVMKKVEIQKGLEISANEMGKGRE